MKCDLCDSKATVFLTQIVNGKMQKVNLCESCAKEKGVTDPTGFALADLLFGLGNEQQIETALPELDECPACGYTLAQLKKTGRVGCGECYEVFSQSLKSLVKAMHTGTSHCGKIPVGATARRLLSEKNAALEERLRDAIKGERYEDAAKIRDEIEALNGENAISAKNLEEQTESADQMDTEARSEK